MSKKDTDIPDRYFKIAHDILITMGEHSGKPGMIQYNELVKKVSSYTSEELDAAACSILHTYTEKSMEDKEDEFDFYTCYSYILILTIIIYVLKERTKF